VPVVDELVPALLAHVLIVGVHGGLGLVQSGLHNLVEEHLVEVGVVVGHLLPADLGDHGMDEGHLLFDLLMGGHDGVVHLVVGQLLGAGLDHDDLALGSGHSQVELGGVLLLLIGVEHDLAVHIAHLQAADGAGPGDVGVGQAGRHADHGGDLGGAVVIHAHDGGGDHHVVAEIVGEQRPDGPVNDPAGQHGGQGGLALPAQEGAGDAAHGVQLLLKVHAQGEEVDAIPGPGGGGDRHQHGGVAVVDHGRGVGQLSHLAHLDLQGPAAEIHLKDLVVGELLVCDNG